VTAAEEVCSSSGVQQQWAAVAVKISSSRGVQHNTRGSEMPQNDDLESEKSEKVKKVLIRKKEKEIDSESVTRSDTDPAL
jgi:hypothetical protein